MATKDTSNGIMPNGNTATVKCGNIIVTVRYEDYHDTTGSAPAYGTREQRGQTARQ
jgi:hypothetical protein